MNLIGSAGQQRRAINIAKGIVSQEVLRRALGNRGISAEVDRTSYRDADLFDLYIELDGDMTKLDVKSWHYFTNYADVGRDPFSEDLVVQHADYPGPDWRRFFPMLGARTQVGQEKEAYCFCIASSIDPRTDIDTNRIGHALTAFPYGESLPFLSTKRLISAREESEVGFYIGCSYVTESLFSGQRLQLDILGEWNGGLQKETAELTAGSSVVERGPFSGISSFQIDRAAYEEMYGHIEISVSRNDLDGPVRNTTKRDINVVPEHPLLLRRNDFCNLLLPTDYTVYVIGWHMRQDFLEQCRQYTGWIWPKDKVNKYENQPWVRLTERDHRTITKAGFDDCIQSNPPLLSAGWMKTYGRGGACCYVYPNIGGANGGVKETNLYVLPQDVRVMDELGAP